MPPPAALVRQSLSAQFAGPSARLWSPTAANEQTVNFFRERTDDRGAKVQAYLRATEGLTPFAQVAGETDTHGLFTENNRTFGCCGTTFFEVNLDGTTTFRGAITYLAGRPATIVSNGIEIVICSGGTSVYTYNLTTNAFALQAVPTAAGVDITMIEFVDGYVLAQVKNSRRVYYSALFDATTWPTLNYFERSWGSDDIAFIKRFERNILVQGSKTGEIWVDTGDSNSPFQPLQGSFIDTGCIAGGTGQRDGTSVIWLSEDERGGGQVVKLSGYQPVKISTYPIDVFVAASEGGLDQATAFCHQHHGHVFYWLQTHFGPGAIQTTPVFDLPENTWSERAIWNKATGLFEPHVARCHTYAFQRHLVGVLDSGIIYDLSFSAYSDSLA